MAKIYFQKCPFLNRNTDIYSGTEIHDTKLAFIEVAGKIENKATENILKTKDGPDSAIREPYSLLKQKNESSKLAWRV